MKRLITQERVWKWVQRLEANLIRVLILCVVLLAVIQVLPHNPVEDLLGPKAQLEELMDPQISEPAFSQLGPESVTFELADVSSLAKAHVLINGIKAGSFTDKMVTLKVVKGDRIAIDGTFYHRTFRLRVVHASPNVEFPSEGQEITVSSRLVELPLVQIGQPTIEAR